MAPRRVDAARKDADLDFERLYAGHRADVFRAALRELGNVHDAEDVTQAAFIDAYRAVLRGSRPEAPRAWLLAIAENVRRRRFRTALRRPREEPLAAEAASAAEPTYEQANALRSALAALPPQQRDVFLLREIAGLSYDEIAEDVGSTVGAVQMLLFRARRTLRTELEPPPVARRLDAVLPIPVWLTGLAARSDSLVLSPRVAGVLGAAVLAATGVTAGRATAPPDQTSPRIANGAALAVSAPAPRAHAAAVGAQPLALPARPDSRPPGRAVPAALAPRLSPVAAPVATAPPAPAARTEARPGPAGVVRPRRLPPVRVVEAALKAVPAATAISAQTSQRPASTPLEQAGAAAAAGADGPPLPALPLDTLPPVP